jgi:hemerythrin-like domain-containing protein
MTVTGILASEHRVTEQVLRALEEMNKRFLQGHRFDSDDAYAFIDFFSSFTDFYHRQKEERFLFPAAQSCGIPTDSGLIAGLVRDHRYGRALFKDMESVIESAAALAEPGASVFSATASAYVSLLRAHVNREESELFPMLERMLTEEMKGSIITGFEQLDIRDWSGKSHDHYLDVADALAQRFHVAPVDLSAPATDFE